MKRMLIKVSVVIAILFFVVIGITVIVAKEYTFIRAYDEKVEVTQIVLQP